MKLNKKVILSKFEENGLVASFKERNNIEIIGGTELIDTRGFSVFKNGFMILRENEQWICRVPGRGQLIVEKSYSELNDAVDAVCKYYLSLEKDFFD